MKGNNTIKVCHLEMVRIVETFLNEHVFTKDELVKVESVKAEVVYNSSPTFEIELVSDDNK